MKTSAASLFCLLLLGLPGAGVAALSSNVFGTFRLVPEQSDDIERAIDAAIAPMNFVWQPFARSRLRKINPSYHHITIGTAADDVVMQADASTPVRTPPNGVAIKWRREDGEPFNVSGNWHGDVFEQIFVSGTGKRINRFSPGPDGNTLIMHVEVSGGGLPGTMTYQLVYRRGT